MLDMLIVLRVLFGASALVSAWLLYDTIAFNCKYNLTLIDSEETLLFIFEIVAIVVYGFLFIKTFI